MLSMFRKPSSSESFVDVTSNSDTGGETPTPDSESATTDPPQPAAATTNTPKPSKGGLCSTRTLYEGLADYEGNWEWQAEYPADLVRKGPAPDKLPPNRLYALLINEKRTGLKSQPLRMDSVTVQSPHVKKVLAHLLADSDNAGELRLRNPVLARPYRELYHVWLAFEEAVRKAEREAAAAEDEGGDEVAARHLGLFYDLVRRDVERLRRKQLPLDPQHKATFNTLFAVFRPGTVVYRKKNDGRFDRFYKVKCVHYSSWNGSPSSNCYVYCADLAWDGKILGWMERMFIINSFAGAKKLTELELFPAELHPEYEAVKARLLERGRKWEAMRMKPTVVEYSGPTPEVITSDRWGRGGGVRMVNGRVIIDPAAYEAYHDEPMYLRSIEESGDYFKPELTIDAVCDDDEDDDETSLEAENGKGSDSDSDDEEPHDEQGTATKKEDVHRKPLSDDMLILTSHVIYGFYLKSKTWVRLFIDLASDVPWNYDAFDRLVLPSNFKQLILAFVESQAQNRDVFDDIIEGKGQSIIMLLHRAPGLGKTLTAEAVSDRLKKPLYSVQAGELGSDASDVETKLEQILEMAAKWDAVLLLDEADVFLEQRHHSDLERNKIVSVFLRLLEYYRGILFLTSNRVETFDEAFRSRIHLKINYPDLDAAAKIGIWKNFIEASRKKNGSNVSDADIRELAEYPFNGREIKNMVKTAQLLASREKWPLEMRHFRVCLDVMEDGKGQQARTLEI